MPWVKSSLQTGSDVGGGGSVLCDNGMGKAHWVTGLLPARSLSMEAPGTYKPQARLARPASQTQGPSLAPSLAPCRRCQSPVPCPRPAKESQTKRNQLGARRT